MSFVKSLPMVLALAPALRANQLVLNPAAVHSVTAAVGFEYVGNCNLQVGFNTAYDIAHDGLVRFDLASSIPPGSRVNSAQLALDGIVLFTGTMNAHRITTAWSACPGTTTWTIPWSQPGGDYLASSGTALIESSAPAVFASNPMLVADVQTWVDQPSSNHGWQLRDPIYWAEAYYSVAGVTLSIDWDPPCPAPTTYCVGAPNSVGAGAVIANSGTARISDADVGLVVTGCAPNAPGFFFFGPLQQQTPWGNGFLCVDGSLARLLPAVFANAQGVAVRPIDFTTGSASAITPGSTWNFQYKYRDIVPGGTGFTSSNALSATFCP
ncbi:MAG: hypothetical protein HZA53_00385 [Planctomycetes bacterium]|nr:hypothetical protein [Planctomycetota bacterium]